MSEATRQQQNQQSNLQRPLQRPVAIAVPELTPQLPGNQVLQRLLDAKMIQAKLSINKAGDEYEQEADRVADQVMRLPDSQVLTTAGSKPPHVQRACNCEEEIQRQPIEEEEELLQPKELPGQSPALMAGVDQIQRQPIEEEEELLQPKELPGQSPALMAGADQIQRQPIEEEEELLQPKELPGQSPALTASVDQIQRQPIEEEEELLQPKEATGHTPTASSSVAAQVRGLRGGGRPLSPSTRAFFEPRFGRDFSQIRVHTDARAAELAQAVNALAFTARRDIVFGRGQYAPGSATGKRLLAHELVHTIQQRQGDHRVHIQRACSPTDIAAKVATRSACTDRFDDTFVTGSSFRFNVNCDTFATGQNTALTTFARGLPPTTTFEIHGYASVEGSASFNQNLSCARALAAQKLLTDPLPAGAGIPASRITGVINHGPVSGAAASRRAVVLSTTTPPPPTVALTHIQASTSPAGMADRIPPRVDTIVGVGIVGGSPHMLPVTLSIDGAGGGNGTATINGAPTANLMASAAVLLRGVNQTAVGRAGNLRLVANQGGARLATSNNFSVSAIPQNWRVSFRSIVAGPLPGRAGTWRGFIVDDRWESDSRPGTHNISDLDQTEISEEVQSNPGSGVFAGVAVSTSGFLPGNAFTTDTHASPVSLLTGSGQVVLKQTSKFHDHRSGSRDIPTTNSGYLITHTAFRIPLLGIVFVNHFKRGAATTANGVTSAAGVGSVSRTQRV